MKGMCQSQALATGTAHTIIIIIIIDLAISWSARMAKS